MVLAADAGGRSLCRIGQPSLDGICVVLAGEDISSALKMATKAQRKAVRKYLASPRGKAARKRAQDRYNHSKKGKASRRNYLRSCKGKEATARYKKTFEL